MGALVTGVTYRHPGILAKTITTLDVLSGGRAWLGIGAAWNQQEHDGLGVPFPPVAERFERLEEALQIVLQMWSEDDGPYQGNHYQLAQALNSPQVLSRPHPPILIGGAGERKTLRLVAKYADACNVFGDAAMCRHKFAVLREHCEREDRDFDEIEKTAYFLMNLGEDGSGVDETVERLGALADAGTQAAIGAIVGVEDLRTIELVGEKIIPQIREL